MNAASPNSRPTAADKPEDRVAAYLESFVQERPLPPNLAEAIRYVLLGGGKRLRPLLVIRCCQAVGGTDDQAMVPAAAIELIHNFSLVHDDLPAMDDDALRRGRPTLHVHTNEAMAVLAGDAMMSLAFELLARRAQPATLAQRLCGELAGATTDMIGGQVYDTLPEFDDNIAPIQQLRVIHRHKTGAIIRCACRMGAIAGEADNAQLDAVTDYAEAIGLMFQVVDDLLDVTQTTEQLGKTVGKDAEQGKLTYPGVMGIDASREHVARLQTQAHEALTRLTDSLQNPARIEPLRQLCDYMAVRSR